MACCTRAAKNGAIGVQRRRCRWTRPRGMRRCTPGATNSATAVQPPLPAPVRLGFLAGDGFELLVEPHPAAGLDQATGGHGGGQHGPGLVGHPGGGEPGWCGRPRWRLRRLGDDKGLVMPRWCGVGLWRRSGRGAAPALLAGDLDLDPDGPGNAVMVGQPTAEPWEGSGLTGPQKFCGETSARLQDRLLVSFQGQGPGIASNLDSSGMRAWGSRSREWFRRDPQGSHGSDTGCRVTSGGTDYGSLACSGGRQSGLDLAPWRAGYGRRHPAT